MTDTDARMDEFNRSTIERSRESVSRARDEMREALREARAAHARTLDPTEPDTSQFWADLAEDEARERELEREVMRQVLAISRRNRGE